MGVEGDYTVAWDTAAHKFTITYSNKYVAEHWKAGTNQQVQVRFEGTVAKNTPVDRKVANQWALTLNNMITPSNIVDNMPPVHNPSKKDNQSKEQGDPTVSIDGKTMLLGDTGNYLVTLDLKQTNNAYRVWKAGITDDFDDEYVAIDESKIEVLDQSGKDVTGKFNIQIKDGVAYVYAKTVDTWIPKKGVTVKGDPQPKDLAKYSTNGKHDPLNDPAIDQNLLGQTYQVVMPYKVVKVKDGYTVRNKAIQVTNDTTVETNEVSNPLKPVNPAKDVTVKVGGESIDGRSVYKDRTFLYQLDSSVIPADRAYPQVSQWRIVDPLNTEFDQYTGQWAVYATRDLYRDGKVLAAKGDKLAGNGFDSSKLGGELFTATADANGQVTVEATEAYRALVSADNAHENGWRAYIQCKRLKVSERVENQFTEIFNDKEFQSNIVWTRTPDMTPSIHIEKYDVASGEQAGDRDDVKDALKMAGDSQQIAFKITNTSKTDSSTGEGAWYLAKDLRMVDRTIAGEGEVSGRLGHPRAQARRVHHHHRHVEGRRAGRQAHRPCEGHRNAARRMPRHRPVRRPAAHRRQPDRRREVRRRHEGRRRRVRHDRPQAGQGRRQDPMRGHHRGLEHRRLERLPRGSRQDRHGHRRRPAVPHRLRRCRRGPLGRTSQDLDRQARRACRQMIR